MYSKFVSDMTLYIAGPMSGIEDFNYPAFKAAAEYLRFNDYEVVNPAENFGGRQDLSWETYLRAALAQVMHSDGVVLLQGWEASEGVRVELEVARALGIPITYFIDYQDAPELFDD